MRTIYKPPKTVAEQTEYLHNTKNVDFIRISEADAQNELYECNYINLITPYKHRFARTDKSGEVIRDSLHRHQYDRIVDFSEYHQAYCKERTIYPVIYSNIQKFESKMNAIVSYEVIHFYKVGSYSSFVNFVSDLKANVQGFRTDPNSKYNADLCDRMQDNIETFFETMNKYDDIYIFMDRLSLSELITVFRCCNTKLRAHIYKQLKEHDGVLGYDTFESFDELLSRITGIRNYVCHFNSLEVLVMYLHIKNKTLRPSSDRKRYQKIIKKLSVVE